MPEVPISARGVARRFGSFEAVRDFDLDVAQGEVFGLLGANGAGKTTAIRMLCGTLAPSAGAITVAGVDMLRDARRARSRIGYVTQRFTLYGDLTARENLQLQGGLYGVEPALLGERIAQSLQRFRLAGVEDQRAAALPLGYQRGLAVAAALLHQPDVLFLDEPTSGIDPLARQQLWELVYELAAGGMGVLVTTHYMDEALFCDRLALMERGRIIAGGTPQALLAMPLAAPPLEVRCDDEAASGAWLAARPEVREVLPRAGRHRIRLQSGLDPQAWAQAATAQAAGQGLALRIDAQAPRELEDVVVALLEQQEAAA
ncbi:ABC transporter ATP-binding protein [Caenimonas terrae]|uniref:ABC transporter ATP-binding protein n=1 Tax=Caenimonas terrae TaxID=696074 RepID=A0ABW0NKR1_9BURK